MLDVKLIQPRGNNETLYYIAGCLVLLLNKVRHSIQGYTQPRSFPISQIQRAIDYDFAVVKLWMQHLVEYLGPQATLKNKTILELGPGPDLGIGILTLIHGAHKYNALDVHNLMKLASRQFYDQFFKYLKEEFQISQEDIECLRRQVDRTLSGQSDRLNDRLNYVCDKHFDISVFGKSTVDLVFSQAAFEHFDDIERVMAELSRVAKPGAVLVAEVDLRTHTRWIRDVDPLNIYRYADFFYNTCKFSGSPNRLRSFEYEQILKTNGWTNVQILPMVVLDKTYVLKTQSRLAKRFQDQRNGMEQLIVTIRATKE
jgi:SAM-dependent methyltransferase